MKVTLQFFLYLSLCLLSVYANALDVNITIKTEGGGKPKVIGQTNLPDGMKLMITISRKASSYRGQDHATVMNGVFQAGPFTQKGQPFNPGTYMIEVSSPLTALQPQSVRKVLGKEGKNLQGQYVDESSLGDKMVRYESTFEVGGGASEQLDSETRKQSEKELHKWWSETCKLSCELDRNVASRENTAFNWDSCYSECLANGRGY
jgi:hypothetical protein